MIGILPNPFVALLWALEQLDIHVLGSTPRASDGRIIMSYIINVIFAGLLWFVYNNLQKPSLSLMLMPILAYLSSHNVFHTLGITKPHVVKNEA